MSNLLHLAASSEPFRRSRFATGTPPCGFFCFFMSVSCRPASLRGTLLLFITIFTIAFSRVPSMKGPIFFWVGPIRLFVVNTAGDKEDLSICDWPGYGSSLGASDATTFTDVSLGQSALFAFGAMICFGSCGAGLPSTLSSLNLTHDCRVQHQISCDKT